MIGQQCLMAFGLLLLSGCTARGMLLGQAWSGRLGTKGVASLHVILAKHLLVCSHSARRCDLQPWPVPLPASTITPSLCRPVSWHQEDDDKEAEEKQISVHMVHVQDYRAVLRVRPGLSRLMPSCC